MSVHHHRDKVNLYAFSVMCDKLNLNCFVVVFHLGNLSSGMFIIIINVYEILYMLMM